MKTVPKMKISLSEQVIVTSTPNEQFAATVEPV